jgi:protein SCO1/2
MRHVHILVVAFALSAAAGQAIATSPAPSEKHHQHDVMAPADVVPSESVYQLKAELADQHGAPVKFESLRGRPTLITLFYTSCQSVCPVITVALQRIEDELTAEQRARLRVAMISLDAARDTPEKLRQFSSSHKLDDRRWLLARASADTVRDIAAVLGIRYRQLPDGSFSHSAVITLLDADGVIRARTENLTQPDAAFVQSVRTYFAGP